MHHIFADYIFKSFRLPIRNIKYAVIPTDKIKYLYREGPEKE